MIEQLKQELELAALRSQQGLDQLDCGDLEGVRLTLKCILAETRAASGRTDATHTDQHLLTLEIHTSANECIQNGGDESECYFKARQEAIDRRIGPSIDPYKELTKRLQLRSEKEAANPES